jgi:hypothetical protein
VPDYTKLIARREGQNQMLRVKCSVGERPVAYLHRRTDTGSVQCLLSNGRPASLQYAGIESDEPAVTRRIETAATSEELVTILRAIGRPDYTYDPLPDPRTLQAKRIQVKCTDTVYHNSFFVYRDSDSDPIHCKSATSNSQVDLESAGILSDTQGAAFTLEAARTSEELAALLYQIGSKRFEYEAH